MATPFPSRQPAPTHWIGKARTDSMEWRCTRCAKLLGVHRDGQMHLRLGRGHEYLAGFPITATCRGCATLNRVARPAG